MRKQSEKYLPVFPFVVLSVLWLLKTISMLKECKLSRCPFFFFLPCVELLFWRIRSLHKTFFFLEAGG